MLQEITWEDFRAWQEFDVVEPIGGQRGDWQAAGIISAIWNVVLARGENATLTKPSDWLLKWRPAKAKVVSATEGSEQPVQSQPAQKPTGGWQRMKAIAQMHYSLYLADKKRKERRGRRR